MSSRISFNASTNNPSNDSARLPLPTRVINKSVKWNKPFWFNRLFIFFNLIYRDKLPFINATHSNSRFSHVFIFFNVKTAIKTTLMKPLSTELSARRFSFKSSRFLITLPLSFILLYSLPTLMKNDRSFVSLYIVAKL